MVGIKKEIELYERKMDVWVNIVLIWILLYVVV